MSDYAYQSRVAQHATVSGTALELSDFGFTAAQIASAKFAMVSPIGGGVNYLCTGDDPTPAFGHPIVEKGSVSIRGQENLDDFKIVRNGAVDVEVTITLGW